MRIIALVPGGISEQILFFPTLEDLKKQYPKAAIDVMIEPRAKAAYRVCPYVNEVLVFDYRDRNGLADYLNLLGIIRDREYDMALSLSQRWTIGLLLWLNGIPIRIGYKNNASWFLSDSVPLKSEQYAAHKYHDLLQALGIQSSCPELKVTLPKEDIDWAEAEQKRLDIEESGYILLYDGFKGGDDTYPVAKWRKIVEDLQQKQPNLPIVLLRDSENERWVATTIEDRPNLKVVSPPDLGKLAAIVAGANLMLCTDSVPMHLSVAVGTYTIALFGSTDATKLLPPNSERSIGIQSPTKKVADIEPETILQQIWRG
ncbi:MAG: glycosyltransferase family 9 protein [Hydrococcus sp. C42_A2020_068]|nr:glycosyltransferase family 9 protein [Hydrococcus sp. C42_A2020_068]